MPDHHTGYLISVVDDDPLRARKDARELLAALGEVDPTARLDLPGPGTPVGAGDKGGPSAETVGLMLSAGSFVVALVQTWLARVPQRTIVVKRPDGATLQITGKEAREDDTLVERFLADDGDGTTAS
ncbi:effector-associated constant component EACC1 [Streptomyces pseudovenezuelae]|uniref:Uncharacterized protein n=1 Tax=Streptomyces pseudovenezuelae TaxID=67350 RepID=A0ABZ1X5K3_9ACTN|nr:hypothetical protein [Streptomyces pseudovenezuelae]